MGVMLTWPVRRVGHNHWELHGKPAELNLKVALSLDEWYVLPSELQSPLRRFLEGERDLGVFRFTIVGKSTPVLMWQALRCFAKVPEFALTKMLMELEVDLREHNITGEGRVADRLALWLMLRLDPSLGSSAAAERIRQRQLAENTHTSEFLDDLTPEAISDCVLLGDQKDTAAVVEERHKVIKQRAANKQGVEDLITNFYPKAPEIGKKSLSKAQAKKHAQTVMADRRRFFASLDANADWTVAQSMPPSVMLVTDEPNGRWLISHPNFKVKSISWSMRGTGKAAKLVLATAWGWHTESTGEPMPAHLQDTDGCHPDP